MRKNLFFNEKEISLKENKNEKNRELKKPIRGLTSVAFEKEKNNSGKTVTLFNPINTAAKTLVKENLTSKEDSLIQKHKGKVASKEDDTVQKYDDIVYDCEGHPYNKYKYKKVELPLSSPRSFRRFT